MVINKKKFLELDQIQRARSSNSVSVLPCEKGTYQMKLEFGVFRIRYQSIPIYVRSNSAKFNENWSMSSKTDIWRGGPPPTPPLCEEEADTELFVNTSIFLRYHVKTICAESPQNELPHSNIHP